MWIIHSLTEKIREKRKSKKILLISHAVLGYPSFESNTEMIDIMAETGVDIIELQVPFSDPLADGPYFTQANEVSVANGTRISECFEFAWKIVKKHPHVLFVFTAYYNTIYKYGIERFVKDTQEIGIYWIIVPDLPMIEEGKLFREACDLAWISAICMVTIETDKERMVAIGKISQWFIYVQSRPGVTGAQTSFWKDTDNYLARCNEALNLPLAVGFGITCAEDVSFLIGKADIAICCTKAVRTFMEDGPEALRDFLKGLQEITR